MADPSANLPGPAWRYRELFSPAEFAALLKSLESPAPAGLRVNTLKISVEEAAARWPAAYGWEIQEVPFCPAGWTLAPGGEKPGQTSEFKLGFYYLQDAASMLPAQLFSFDPEEQPLMLDLAAAPGGKSTHLAALSAGRGLLLANDSSYGRLPALHTGLLDWGAMNAVVSGQPGEKFGQWFPAAFDKILLDAPCSMENLRPAKGSPRRSISARERQSLAARQAGLLYSAVLALRVGGQVVYSTCTLAPEENEGVLDGILKAFPGSLRLDDASRVLPAPAPGLAGFEGRAYTAGMEKGIRLWPHRYGTGGFFAARLTRLEAARPQRGELPGRPFSKTGLEPLSRAQQAAALDAIWQYYGFDLSPILEDQALSLWKRETTILAIPERYLREFSNLPVINPGFPLFSQTQDGLIISHELAARFGMRFERGIFTLPDEDRPAWLRGSDLPGAATTAYGLNDVLVVMDEQKRLLGRGKVLRDRLKNMLPRRLALR